MSSEANRRYRSRSRVSCWSGCGSDYFWFVDSATEIEIPTLSQKCDKGRVPVSLASRLRDVDAVVGFYGDVVYGGGAFQFVPGEFAAFEGALQRLE